MTNLQKISVSRVLSSSMFWLPVFHTYFQYRGISSQNAFTILSLYSLFIVVLEYPTGVIGDYFSHKNSVVLGLISTALGMFLFSLAGNMWFYLFCSFFVALGLSLMSGSDTALLHTVSRNFKKDHANIGFMGLLWVVFSTSIGAYLPTFGMSLPYIVTGCLFLLAAIPLAFVSVKSETNQSGNIFLQAKSGLLHVRDSHAVFSLIGMSSVAGMFTISLKWFYNPLFETLDIPVSYWGILIGLSMLLVAVGTKLFGKRKEISLRTSLTLFVVFIAFFGITSSAIVSVGAIFIFNIIHGYVQTQLDVSLVNKVPNSTKASLLSFKSLLVRLFSSLYIFLSGYWVRDSSYLLLFSLTAVVLALSFTYFSKRLKAI